MKEEVRAKLKDIFEWIYCFVIAVVVALLIKYFVGTPTVVKQTSMFPTLKQNERLILNRLTRTFDKAPERGDIVTFEAPSKMEYSTDEIDYDNPVAVYNHKIEGIFSKFSYYVIEFSKVSYIKRVIGLPGDHVEIKDGKVYLNGELLEENYLDNNVETTSLEGLFTDVIVPEGTVFVMGDNRNHSTDSRSVWIGMVDERRVIGKALFRLTPFSKFGSLD